MADQQSATTYGWRFWTIFVALFFTAMLSALDISVITTALPTIVHDLTSTASSSNTYIYAWIADAFLLTSTSFAPLFGQTADLFGRRPLLLAAVALFAAGSAVSGAARSMAALIGGRAVQGIGAAGMAVLSEVVVCDLVPLRQRPQFMGILFAAWAITLATGPVVGGALSQHASWRWIFYINLPVAALAFGLLAVFLRVGHPAPPPGFGFSGRAANLRQVDYGGNALLVAATVSLLLGLSWAGTAAPWGSARTLVPLMLGFVGLGGFLVLEGMAPRRLLPTPTMPLRRMANRTTLATLGLTFVHALLTFAISYFLPVYFQAVLAVSPTDAGVDALPSAFCSMPGAILAGAGVSRFGRYRPFHFLGFALLAAGFGMFSLLAASGARATTAYWVGAQIVAASGAGVLFTTTLPAIQAPLAEADQAAATATWSFVRSFGGIWGVALPSAIFNARVNALLGRLDAVLDADAAARLQALLRDGGAFATASRTFITSLAPAPAVQAAVLSIYVDSLRLCWQVCIGFAGVGFLLALLVREVPMREHLDTPFGLVDAASAASAASAVSAASTGLPSDQPLPNSTSETTTQPSTEKLNPAV